MGRYLASLMAGALAVILWTAERTSAQTQRPRQSLGSLQKTHADLRAAYFARLDELLAFCRDQQLPEGVAEIEKYRIEPAATALRLAALPARVEPEISPAVSGADREWRAQLRFERKEYAKKLYLLSRRALHSGYPAYAYELVRETAVHDSDHAKARELLGFVQLGDQWVTPYARKMLQTGHVWHPQFGWLPKAHVERYERGERNVDGRWMSAEKEAEIRRDFDRGWEIRTDHYLIKTNYSLERGVELGRALEDFYAFFHQTFAGFFNDPEQLARIFNGTAPQVNKAARPYLVNYYRSREEYIQRLEKQFPAIQKTNGIYLTNGRTAHFYYDPAGNQEATLFHEATHQLFFESHPADRPIGQTAHFWIIEGIACYMESFQRSDGETTVGDPRYIRFAGARANYLEQNYYVPLKEFAAMGMQEFQASPLLAKNYTQSAGLAQFFMQYDNGRYRDALVAHLAELYSGNPRKREFPTGLDELTGVSYADLDRQYGEFLRETQQMLQAATASP
jgi:hypothetical protein